MQRASSRLVKIIPVFLIAFISFLRQNKPAKERGLRMLKTLKKHDNQTECCSIRGLCSFHKLFKQLNKFMIIHHPVPYLKHDLEFGFCPRLQMGPVNRTRDELCQLGPFE
jgi:hypothetical protein